MFQDPVGEIQQLCHVLTQLGQDGLALVGHLDVVRTGEYQFELRRWQRECGKALGEGMPVLRVTDGVLSGGKALMTGLGPAGKTYSLTFPNGKK